MSGRGFRARASLTLAGTIATSLFLVSAPLAALGARGWSAPVRIEQVGKEYPQLESVSCASSSFCAALDIWGHVVMYNGARWSPPKRLHMPTGRHFVSCASRSLCAVVGDFMGGGEHAEALTYNGARWTSGIRVGGGTMTSVSCTAPSFCAAVGEAGDVHTYKSGRWSGPDRIDPAIAGSEFPLPPIIWSVSCVSASFCAAVDAFGRALTYDGAAWSAPMIVDTHLALTDISCASSSVCVALGGAGQSRATYATVYNGTSWSTPVKITAHLTLNSVSCGSSSFCVAVGGARAGGYAAVYNGRAWSAPARIDTGSALTSVSCPSSSFCVAIDYGGHALTYRTDRPRRPKP